VSLVGSSKIAAEARLIATDDDGPVLKPNPVLRRDFALVDSLEGRAHASAKMEETWPDSIA
jgi:hypothetical protein